MNRLTRSAIICAERIEILRSKTLRKIALFTLVRGQSSDAFIFPTSQYRLAAAQKIIAALKNARIVR